MTKPSVSSLASPFPATLFVATLLPLFFACLTACSLLEGNQQDSPSNSIDSGQMEVMGTGGARLERVAGHNSEITAVFDIPGTAGSTVASVLSVDRNGQVLLWKIPPGEAFRLMQLPQGASSTAFSKSEHLLAASFQNVIRVFSLEEQKEKWSLTKLDVNVTAMAFSPDGRKLLIGAVDGRVYQWKFQEASTAEDLDLLEKQKLLEAYIGHASIISALVYHPLGRIFFSADWKGGLSAWANYDADPFEGRWDRNLFGAGFFAEAPVKQIAGESVGEGIDYLVVSPDGQWLAAARREGAVELWQVRGFRRVSVLKAHQGVIQAIAFAPDGQRIASAGRDGKLKIMRISTGGPALDADRYRLEAVRDVAVAGIVRMDWLASGSIIAGDSKGKIMQIGTEEFN